jgi:hypothetical protein
MMARFLLESKRKFCAIFRLSSPEELPGRLFIEDGVAVIHCAPGRDNCLQNGEKFLASGMRELGEIFGERSLTGSRRIADSGAAGRLFAEGLRQVRGFPPWIMEMLWAATSQWKRCLAACEKKSRRVMVRRDNRKGFYFACVQRNLNETVFFCRRDGCSILYNLPR